MAISTYYDPKASSFVSRWKPKEQDEASGEEWLAENMAFMGLGSEQDRRERAGFTTPFSGNQKSIGQQIADTSDYYFDDTQVRTNEGAPVATALGLPTTMPTLDRDRTTWEDDLTPEQRALAEEYQEYEKEAVKTGFLEGVQKGAAAGAGTGNPLGVVAGGLVGGAAGALGGGYRAAETYGQEKADEEAQAILEAQAADAARLAQEAAIANQRLGGGSVPVQQDPFATNYSYQQPTGYDDWYSSIFGA